MYKGSFQLKKQGSRSQTVVDQQLVMKFRKNTQGSYNVYGKGINEIGIFNLVGTLVTLGPMSGQVELYRIYLPQAAKPADEIQSVSGMLPPSNSMPISLPGYPSIVPGGKPYDQSPLVSGGTQSIGIKSGLQSSTMSGGLSSGIGLHSGKGINQRRGSTRLVKLPARLEEDDPEAQIARIMQTCATILRQMREKDLESQGFFSEPVDPVALGIPTYPEVIKEPMDLKTVHRKMENNEIETPEEFARLVRLIFENAITFNVDPTHSVHQAARGLLIFFNQKYQAVERQVENLRKNHKNLEYDNDGASTSTKGGKKKTKDNESKKRKRGSVTGGSSVVVDEVTAKSLKKRRLEEAQAMSVETEKAFAAIVDATPLDNNPLSVTRTEFNLLLKMIQLVARHNIQTHTLLAELAPGDDDDDGSVSFSVRDNGPLSQTLNNIANDTAHTASGGGGAASTTSNADRKKTTKKPTKTNKIKKENNNKDTDKDKDKENDEHTHSSSKGEDNNKSSASNEDARKLTLEEQEILTETINKLPAEDLPAIIQIIRESAKIDADEDEIDLEIDQLDASTQRKLLRHINKYIQKPKRSKTKKKSKGSSSSVSSQNKKHDKPSNRKKSSSSVTSTASKENDKDDGSVSAPKANASPPSTTANAASGATSGTTPTPKSSEPKSFFAFKGDSDSDSDEESAENVKQTIKHPNTGGKVLAPAASGSGKDKFRIDGFDLPDDDDTDDDTDDDNVAGGGGFANWNISSKSETKNAKASDNSDNDDSDKDDNEDDAWGAAREEAAVTKAKELERKAREEKMKADAEKQKKVRMDEAAKRKEEFRVQQQEEKAKAEKLREQKEKEAEEERKKAREDQKRKLMAVKADVDLDAQRELMKQFEDNYIHGEMGSNSPSSDFGF